MNCIKEEKLQKYLDGEMKPDEKAGIDKHLHECPLCSERLEQQRARANHIKGLLTVLIKEEMVRPPLPFSMNKDLTTNEFSVQPKSETFRNGRLYAKRIVIGLCAACAVGAVFLYRPWVDSNEPQQVVQMQSTFQEVDANRPFSEQETVITVIDPEGNDSYLK